MSEQQGLPSLPISPVPLQVNVGAAELPTGDTAVLLHVSTPLGAHYYFLPPDYAEQLVKELEHYIKQAKTGLIVPDAQSTLEIVERGRKS